MTLCKKTQIPLPQNGIIIRKTGKHQYIYKVLKTYRNQNNQPTNTRTIIGKLDPTTNMLIPNNNYYQHYPTTQTTTTQPTQTTTPQHLHQHTHHRLHLPHTKNTRKTQNNKHTNQHLRNTKKPKTS